MSTKLYEAHYSAPSTASGLQRELSRIMTAAVINTHFRQMLLNNPAKALSVGYGGEAFQLENEERRRISAIQATSLADFARQMTQVQSTGMVSSAYAPAD